MNLAQQKPIFVLYADSVSVSNFISLVNLTTQVPGDLDAARLLAVGRLMATFAVIPSIRDLYRRQAEAGFAKWTELTIVTWVQVALLSNSAGILNAILLRGGFLFKSANTVERWLACLKEAEDESEFEPRTAKVLFWMAGAAKLGANLGAYRARFVGGSSCNCARIIELKEQTTNCAFRPTATRTSGSSEGKLLQVRMKLMTVSFTARYGLRVVSTVKLERSLENQLTDRAFQTTVRL